MLYTNQGGTSTAGIKTHSLSLSERLAAALEKRTQSRGATFNGLLDDESDDIFMSSSSSSESSSDSEDESVDSDDVTVTSGAKGKSDSDVNKFLEGIDEKTRTMFEVSDVDFRQSFYSIAMYDNNVYVKIDVTQTLF